MSRKSREEAQYNNGYGLSDEIIQCMIDAYRTAVIPPAAFQGEPPRPSTFEADESTPPAPTPPEVEQQVLPTDPAGRGETDHDQA
jgi:hypothetical protein